MKKLLIILLLFSSRLYAEDIDLEYHLKDGSILIKTVDSEIEELKLYKGYVTKISGLNKLNKLETIIIDRTAFINDFSFIDDIENIKTIVLRFVEINNFDFVMNKPQLSGLIVQSSKIIANQIDLYNSNITYLEISNSELLENIHIENFPCSLGIINYANNSIAEFISYDCCNTKIILSGNPLLDIEKDSRFIMTDFYQFIPLEYQKYIQ